jgi:hypothetical protein
MKSASRPSFTLGKSLRNSHILTAATTRYTSSGAPSTRNHRRRKGLITDVLSPQRNACPGIPTLLSVLSTSVTKRTGDMVYSGARRGRILAIWARITMLHVLERVSARGSTFAVPVELSEGRDVSSGPVSRIPTFDDSQDFQPAFREFQGFSAAPNPGSGPRTRKAAGEGEGNGPLRRNCRQNCSQTPDSWM